MYLADCSFAGQRMTRKNFRLVISGIDYLNDVKNLSSRPGWKTTNRTEPPNNLTYRTYLLRWNGIKYIHSWDRTINFNAIHSFSPLPPRNPFSPIFSGIHNSRESSIKIIPALRQLTDHPSLLLLLLLPVHFYLFLNRYASLPQAVPRGWFRPPWPPRPTFKRSSGVCTAPVGRGEEGG